MSDEDQKIVSDPSLAEQIASDLSRSGMLKVPAHGADAVDPITVIKNRLLFGKWKPGDVVTLRLIWHAPDKRSLAERTADGCWAVLGIDGVKFDDEVTDIQAAIVLTADDAKRMLRHARNSYTGVSAANALANDFAELGVYVDEHGAREEAGAVR